jgi:squalene-hopene/tetraprenyl-beta-curcumene cyclase
VTDSDGYATGYTVYVLKRVGVTLDDERMKKAVNWLKSNQTEDGNWRGNSVNKKRNHATNIGKFMDDAATAYAVLALLEK